MLLCIRFHNAGPVVSVGRSAFWFFWLKGLLAVLALIGTSSAMAQLVCTSQLSLAAGQSSYTVHARAESAISGCDPNGVGLYSDAQGNTATLFSPEGSSLALDMSNPQDGILVFTPAALTNLTSWRFTLYRGKGSSEEVEIEVVRPLSPPGIAGLSGTSGPTTGAPPMTIRGANFMNGTTVFFGGIAATGVVVSSPEAVTATPPAHAAGAVDVRIVTAGGAAVAAGAYTYVAPPVPTVSRLVPNYGSPDGGETVTITGTGFTGATAVTFGSTAATNVTVVSDTSITVTAPAGTGAVHVRVTGPGGISATAADDLYNYNGPATVTGISPSYGATTGGTRVTIAGSNFIGVTAVRFGNKNATSFVVDNMAQITAIAPAGTVGTVDVVVFALLTPSASTQADQFTYQSLPTPGPIDVHVPFNSSGVAVGVDLSGGVTGVGVASPASHGVASASGTSLTYKPAPGFSGTDSFTYTLTNQVGTSATAGTVTVTVLGPVITVTPTTLAATTTGVSYQQPLTADGGTGPYSYTIMTGGLPPGLSLNQTTGLISGTPTTAGLFPFRVQARDATGVTGEQSYGLQVGLATLSIDTASLANGTLGTAYTQALSGSGGVGPYTFAATGLPAGLSVSGSAISGAPTQAGGPFAVLVTMTDSSLGAGAPATVTKTLTMNVSTGGMTLGPATLPAPVLGQAYTQKVIATNGVAPYRYAVKTGTLPAGLSLDPGSGILSGTPTSTGSTTLTLMATDSSTGPGTPLTAFQNYTLDVTGAVPSAPAVNTQTLSNAPVTFRATANAVGGPFRGVAIATPPATGTAGVRGEDITYTPVAGASGAVSFTYTLTNAVGTSAPIPVTVTVNAVPVTAASLQASVSANGTTDIDISSGATGGPFTGANIVSVSPANAGTATLLSTAVPAAPSGNAYTVRFAPAPAFAGMAVITYTISNAHATSSPGTVKVTVAPRKDPTTDPDVTGLIGAQVEAARRFATTQIGNYNQRLEALHGTGRAPSSNGLNVVLPAADRGSRRDLSRCQNLVGVTDRDACLRGEPSPTAMSKAQSLALRDKSADPSGVSRGDGPDLPGEGAGQDKRFAYWTAGTVDFGFANRAAQRAGFKFTTGGVTMGADYRFSDQFSLGAGMGYGHDSTDVGSAGTRSTADSYSGALYASLRPLPTLFVDAVAGFGTLSFDARRWVVEASDFARGKRNGQQFFGSLSAGYEYRTADWLFSPYGRLTASRSTLDQYRESGAGLNALTYFKQNVNTLSGTLGVRAGFAHATRIGTFSPYVRVELQHDFNGQSVAGLAYADIASSGPVYFVSGSPYRSNRVQLGAGTKLRTGGLVFGLDYGVSTGMGGLQQGVRLSFTTPI